jgi:hypothetical protein
MLAQSKRCLCSPGENTVTETVLVGESVRVAGVGRVIEIEATFINSECDEIASLAHTIRVLDAAHDVALIGARIGSKAKERRIDLTRRADARVIDARRKREIGTLRQRMIEAQRCS